MLKQNEVAGDLLDTWTNLLKERRQRVILNGQRLTWMNVESLVSKLNYLPMIHHFFR